MSVSASPWDGVFFTDRENSLILPPPIGSSFPQLVDELVLFIHRCINPTLSLLTHEPRAWSHHTFINSSHSSVYHHRLFVIAFVPTISVPVHITSFFVQPRPLFCTTSVLFFAQLPLFSSIFVRLPSSLYTSIVLYDRKLDTTHVCTLGRI